MRARDLLSDRIIPLDPDNTGSMAINQMEDMCVEHLPLVSNSQYLGLMKSEDLYSLKDQEVRLSDTKTPLHRTYAFSDLHLFEVLRIVHTEEVTVLPVLDEHNHYLGSITHKEVLRAMARFTSVTQPGGIIVLETSTTHYSVSEIARIVETNDAKILSSSVTSDDNNTLLEVTLKLNVMDLSSLIQTFNRYDYVVKASFTEENQYDTLLSERYDLLMRYLNT